METKRIYIGNLDPSVDEYAVMKLFEPFGKIVVFDYMFFLHGPKKGQPRGYCFLEYEKKPEALTAISALNGKRIKGRPLVVSSANKNTQPSSENGGGKHHRSLVHKPTSFGLLRNQKMTQSKSTDAKILAIEQKLAALQKSKSSPSTPIDTPSSSATAASPSSLPPSSQNRRYRPY